jgi:hypothetical protein
VYKSRKTLTELLDKYPALRQAMTERDKCRLVFDHYTQKLNEMKAKVAKKTSANPYYQPNSKKQECIARNERKLRSATEDFNAVSAKALEIMHELFESRFSRVVPFVAQVTPSQLANVQVTTMIKSGKMLRALEDWPEDMLQANERRDAATERTEPQKSEEPITLSRSQAPGPKTEEPTGPRMVKNEIFTTEADDESIIFNMDRLNFLDPKAEPNVQTLENSWGQSANPQQKSPSPSDDFFSIGSYPMQTNTEPQLKNRAETYPSEAQSSMPDHFFTAQPHSSSGFFSSDQAYSSFQPSEMSSVQMAQMQHWMAMFQNPEVMAQMHGFMTQPPANDPFAEADQPSHPKPTGLEPRQSSKNPFTQPLSPKPKDSSFFDLF